MVQPVEVLPKESKLLAFTVDDVFTKEECDEWIALTEKTGYEQAMVNVGNGRQVLMTDVRNNDRCIIDSDDMANKIYKRIEHLIPDEINGRHKISLNERLRFLRYTPGQKFEPHHDGSYVRETGPKKGEQSYLTIQLYLNDACKGGETTFFLNRKEYHVVPKPGMVLIFQHNILHQGSEVVGGIKFVMRSDIMYSAPSFTNITSSSKKN
ncbi:hypothetical protein DFA_07312 [Cavenderia fasciculata]|uniref:Prolyl 4-hydroxylase alpha subunit domain-containing protein n=1 Tax=Cavenderia fasciculata TaxID=261658 RepID=F4PW28_CACFS|nr:uncharacterized protein DFA_07312 [Cavenderia fasciculata]EGG20192.1 hypothetical protein DFA_07312 [Cavenderia fasciculata]|eukprot:XP_004367175.1 hypothetical protein DFA_07312 [Cavenderia fasciculata]